MRKLVATACAAVVLGALAPIASQAVASSHRPSARFAEGLDAQLASASGSERLMVFVHGTSRAAAHDAVDAAGLELVGELQSIGVPVAIGTASAIRALRAEPGVTYVEPNRALDVQLATSRQALRATEAAALPELGFTGAGQTIAVVDGGVDGTHPMFVDPDTGASKVVRNLKVACFNNVPGFTVEAFLGNDPATCPADYLGYEDGGGERNEPFIIDATAVNDTDSATLGGHGTHVAGIAGGVEVTANGETVSGVAPGARIVAVSMGVSLTIYGADAALDWVARHHLDPCGTADPVACPPITVVNNSYGSGGDWDPESATSKLQDVLVDAGVTLVWANGNGDLNGNGGTGADDRSGSDAKHQRAGVIAVANFDDGGTGTRDGALNSSSSRGLASDPTTWPDVSAPGTDITSACRPYLSICTGGSDDPDYGTISGTSMAAPHVAGVVALMKQANPSLTPADIEHLLEDTAYKFQFGAPYWFVGSSDNPDSATSFDKGHGLVDVVAALAAATGATAPAPDDAVCIADPLISDRAGDATRAIVATPLPSEDRVDIVAGDLAWDADGEAITFTIRVNDLEPGNPDGTTGIAFDFNFAHAGTQYFVLATREGDAAEAYLGHIDTTRVRDVGSLPVSFDDATDTITVTVTNAMLAGTDVPAFADGGRLVGLNIVSRRQFSEPATGRGIIADADDAFGTCPFPLGEPIVPEPQPFSEDDDEEPAPTEVDATLTDGDTFNAQGFSPDDHGGGIPGVDPGYSCTGPGDPECVTYVLDLQPASGSGILDVILTSDVAGTVLDDFDWHVYDAAGTEVGSAAGPQTLAEVSVVPIAAPGIYFLVITPFSASTESPFTIEATLNRI